MPDAHVATLTHAPTMLTTDLALRFDPIYEPISRRFLEHPEELADAFARAWFKLTHRDMGPIERYLGPEVPAEELLWQDPLPEVTHELVDADDIAALKSQILDVGAVRHPARQDGLGVGLDVPWQRQARRRQRGAHPPRAAERLGGQRPGRAGDGAARARGDPGAFNSSQNGSGKQISLADLIVLAGSAAVEQAAKDGGPEVEVPFTPGRADATKEQTDADSFDALEPVADGFRNYLAGTTG